MPDDARSKRPPAIPAATIPLNDQLHESSTRKQTSKRWLITRNVLAVLGILAFLKIILAAGHGIGPIGLLLFFGTMEAWGLPKILGWLGVAVICISLYCSGRFNVWGNLGGNVLLLGSWAAFLGTADSSHRYDSVIDSIPFLSLVTAQLALLLIPSARK